MAKKAKKQAAKKATGAKKSKPAKTSKPAAKAKAKPAAPTTSPESPPVKVLKPLTMKQKLALIRIDPTTGRCPHGLAPETCAFCMSI